LIFFARYQISLIKLETIGMIKEEAITDVECMFTFFSQVSKWKAAYQ